MLIVANLLADGLSMGVGNYLGIRAEEGSRELQGLPEAEASPASIAATCAWRTRGQDMFAFSCAACHGSGGKGDGPVAPSLKTPPADLTTIARLAGGTFPAARVESQVTGTGTTLILSHGTREMPFWGPIFRALDPNSDTMNKVRIAKLVAYIESLQVKWRAARRELFVRIPGDRPYRNRSGITPQARGSSKKRAVVRPIRTSGSAPG